MSERFPAAAWQIKKTVAQKQSPKKKPENRFREPMQHFGLVR